MRGYRAFLVSPDGHILDRCEFWSVDDQAAKEHVKSMVGIHDIELWHDDRKVAVYRAPPLSQDPEQRDDRRPDVPAVR